jgi:adenine-specific DNA-methyltransferase
MNQNTNEKLNRFINLLEEIFELDKADLDFGIYRIMNIRRKEIMKFLSEDLPKKVKETLTPFAQNTGEIKERIAAIEKQAAELGIEINASPKLAEEYARYKSQLASGTDLSSLETDVYSALYKFFSRYYDEGDFISKRRYKEGVYAIPYEGEEVKLYWANADQYYIKTTENFRDYTFIDNGKKVHFRLVDATTEKNNNKESDTKKREFMLYKETPERPELKTIEEVDGELVIRFVYDTPDDRKVNWFEANLAAISDAIAKNFKEWFHLLAPAPSEKKKTRTVLEKHLSTYVAKNTFDYFIHKDLRGFLTRELDFFIKSEVIHLDDIDTTDEKRADSYLAKVRAIKRVGKIIIDFLAQIEDFQKKLWLKKKFVVDTNWCITLDRVDEKFYPEIIENEAQIAEWREMYAIHEIEGNLTTVGYSEPLMIEFLRQNKNLVLDTRYFSADFKERLIASIDNLDEQTGGLLIRSENFQTLRLLSEYYRRKVKFIYIDPPYNTGNDGFIYKDGYKDSSWLSMMKERIETAKKIMTDDGVICIQIDDNEVHNLRKLCDDSFGTENFLTTVCVKMSHLSGMKMSHKEKKIPKIKEFLHIYAIQSSNVTINPIYIPGKWDDVLDRYSYYIENPDDPIDSWKYINVNTKMKLLGIKDDNEKEKFRIANANRIFRTAVNDSLSGFPKDNIFREVLTATGLRKLVLNGEEVIFATSRMVDFDGELLPAETIGDIWTDIGINNMHNEGGIAFQNGKKPVKLIHRLVKMFSNQSSIILDFFAGSATTGHAVLNLNRDDGGNRKYVLIEMGEYFYTVTLPRMKKVIYSADWKSGKPQNRNTGISHIMKYITLESYEDTLSNIELDDDKHQLAMKLGDEYMIHYMFDYEAKDSMLSLDAFNAPFSYKLKIIENNETKLKTVDLCETFNYLIGLSVIHQSATTWFKVVKLTEEEWKREGLYEGAVRLERDNSGEYGFKQIEGRLPDGRRALVIWRTITDNLIQSNAALDAYFTKHRINPADREFDVIYVNGDNNLENLRLDDENWKVQRIEPVLREKMFEEAE